MLDWRLNLSCNCYSWCVLDLALWLVWEGCTLFCYNGYENLPHYLSQWQQVRKSGKRLSREQEVNSNCVALVPFMWFNEKRRQILFIETIILETSLDHNLSNLCAGTFMCPWLKLIAPYYSWAHLDSCDYSQRVSSLCTGEVSATICTCMGSWPQISTVYLVWMRS